MKTINDETVLLSGCSYSVDVYTTKNQEHYENTWPKLLPFKDIINLSLRGASNCEFISRVIDFLLADTIYDEAHRNFKTHSKKVDRVIIALTQWDRFDTPYDRIFPHYFWWFNDEELQESIKKNEGERFVDMTTEKKMLWWHKRYGSPNIEDLKENGNMPQEMIKMIDSILHSLLILANICAQKNIPLHIFQMLEVFVLPDGKDKTILEGEIFKRIIHSPLTKKLKELEYQKKLELIGFPFITGSIIWEDVIEENRIHLCDELEKTRYRSWSNEFETANVTIGDGDLHPNELGHKLIAEKVLNKLNLKKVKND
tara:strand:- start:2250 stop:3188 length:939 start_codon:yes stop_codon:yes gene_type:complete